MEFAATAQGGVPRQF